MFVEIIPEKRFGIDRESFTYSVPAALENEAKIGSIAEVPFGKENIRGVIAGILPSSSEKQKYEIKNIIGIDGEFFLPRQYLKIVEWISTYYLCSRGEALLPFLPPKITRPRRQESGIRNQESRDNIKLTAEQERVFDELKQKLSRPSKPILLHGVTGSGKTEIYLSLVEESLKKEKQAIVLVPEIMLTPQLVDRFEKYFPGQVCLMHSHLSKSARFLCYHDFAKSKKQIIIGPRSALLVPPKNLGLIIVDEEHEDSYKQEKNPRYHAVLLAEKIASENKALLVLGSATPRLESYHKTKIGDYELLEIKNRYHSLILPPARIVDLRGELRAKNFSPVSLELKKSISQVLAEKKQVLLFLNRRGMSTFVSCRDCGEVILCPRCAIPLVYHLDTKDGILNCHHCDYKTGVPRTCAKCGSARVKFFGAGIEKIEKEIKEMFPHARIRKIDSKSLQSKGDYEKLHRDLRERKIDILIGTQILAKGLDFPSIDLVGIISADVGLHLPYFRANEKVFGLVTQVSGRSGRRDNPGKTIIQTYWPDSLAIKLAAEHNYKKFYETEILTRLEFVYPPFCHIVRVISEDKNETRAKNNLDKLVKKLNELKIEYIGPAKCFFAKENGRFRYHIILKTKILPNKAISEAFASDPYLIWDVDPIDLL